MIKEKLGLIRKQGKKVVAGLLAAAMTIEQVPLEGAGGWLQSLAATTSISSDDVPSMYADILHVKVNGSETLERFVMLQKKREAEATITLNPGDGASGVTLYRPAIHIDTPIIYYDEVDHKFITTIVSENTVDGQPYGPKDLAKDPRYTLVGGIAVAVTNTTGWTVWDPSSVSTTNADDEDEDDEAVVVDVADTDITVVPSETTEADESVSETKTEKTETNAEDTQDSGASVKSDAETTETETKSTSEKAEAAKASTSQELTEKLESVLKETAESKTSDTENSTESETETKKETAERPETSEDSTSASETTKETETAENPEIKETETTVDSTQEKETEETTAASDKTDEKQQSTAEETTESGETAGEDQTTGNDETVQEPERDTAGTETVAGTENETTSETASGTESNQDIDLYDLTDSKTLIHEPASNQMCRLDETTPAFYYGNYKITSNDQSYDPSKPASLSVKFKFWIDSGYTGQIPEGLEAKCRAWVDMQGYDSSKGQGGYEPHQYYVPSSLLHGDSEFTFVYSNVDWSISMEALKGSKKDPVITWQKNNYASYLMKIKNTSGINNGQLAKEDEVPDNTIFSSYDVKVTVPDNSNYKAYGSAWQYETYYWDEDDKVIKKNDNYEKMDETMFGDKKNSSVNFIGKWIANDLSNVGYDAAKYDESGGAVIIDVTDLSEDDQKIEDPDKLVELGGIPVAYQWNGNATFTFKLRNEKLYPPQFGLDENKNKYDPDKYDPNVKTERQYRIFLPFNNSVTGSDGNLFEQDVTYKGTIYIGDTAAQNADSDSGVVVDSEWDDTETLTRSHAAEGILLEDDRSQEEKSALRALEEKEKQLKEAAEQKELSSAEDTTAAELADDDSQAVISDDTEETSEYDVAEQSASGWERIVLLPEGEENNLGHRWPSSDLAAETWISIPDYKASVKKSVQSEDASVGKKVTYTLSDIGIQDPVDGSRAVPMYRPNVVDTFPAGFDLQEIQFVYPKDSGVDIGDKSPVEYWLGGEDSLLGIGISKKKEDQTTEVPIMEYQDVNGDWQEVEIDTSNFVKTGEEGNKEIYSYDLKPYFDSKHFYPKVVRINFKYCWVPLTKCAGDIRLVGVSRIANPKLTNTAQTHFAILNYLVEQDAGYDEGLIEDPIGRFPVERYEKTSDDSTADINAKESEIKADVYAETWIKDQKKTDPDLLETPITRTYGNYLIKVRNESDSEGYNVNFKLTLHEKEKDLQEGAKDTDTVDGFRMNGIRISKQLLEAGEQPYKRSGKKEDGPYILDADNNRTPAPMLILKNGDTIVAQYTYEELLQMISGKDTGINPSEDYEDTSYYIEVAPDASPLLVTEVTLSYSAFYGKDQLEADGKKQDDQWMRIYGTSVNICEATALSFMVIHL